MFILIFLFSYLSLKICSQKLNEQGNCFALCHYADGCSYIPPRQRKDRCIKSKCCLLRFNRLYLGKINGKVRYSINKEVVEFTPNELKNKTEELMKEYLVNAELKENDWGWGK